MLVAAPLENDPAGGHVDLLHDPVEIRAAAGAGVGGTGSWDRPLGLAVGGQQRGALIGETELMQVAAVAVAGLDLGHLPVALVIDLVVALAVGADDRPLPPREHRLAPVALHADVEHALPGGAVVGDRLEPHQTPGAVDDQRPLLTVAAVAVGEHEGLELRVRRAGVDDDLRRAQVRPRDEALGGHGPGAPPRLPRVMGGAPARAERQGGARPSGHSEERAAIQGLGDGLLARGAHEG